MKRPVEVYKAVATLTGCIIGAGILGIPYVVVRAGFWTGALVLAVVTIAQLVLCLLLGEVALRTRACHQSTGYAQKYLGGWGKYFMLVAMMVGVYGALVAYTIGAGQSLAAVMGGPVWFWAAVFYACMGWLVNGGLRMLEDSELFMESVKFALLVGLLALLFFSSEFDPARLTGFAWERMLIPYGVILFAMLGTPVIPEVHASLKKCRKWTKNVILLGALIPAVTYALFMAGVIGVTGGATSEVATVQVARVMGPGLGMVFHLFAILAVSSSFVALAYALKDTYRLDLGRSRQESWLLTMGMPLVMFMLGVTSFAGTLEVAGTFAGGIAGICIVLAHRKAKMLGERKPEYRMRMNWAGYGALILFFAIGMAYQLALVL